MNKFKSDPDRDRDLLEVPLTSRRSRRQPYDAERFGEIAERIARFIGTARFLVYMTSFVLSWMAWNHLMHPSLRIDKFPFIFLTLMLSLQASYAAPLILLAQNRQTDRDRVQFQEDRIRDERTQADAEFITREIASLRAQVQQVATREFVRSEIRDQLEELLDQLKKDERSGKDS